MEFIRCGLKVKVLVVQDALDLKTSQYKVIPEFLKKNWVLQTSNSMQEEEIGNCLVDNEIKNSYENMIKHLCNHPTNLTS